MRGDTAGERSGSIGFGGTIGVLLFSFLRVVVHFGWCRGGRFRGGEDVVEVVVVEVGVHCPVMLLQRVNKFWVRGSP